MKPMKLVKNGIDGIIAALPFVAYHYTPDIASFAADLAEPMEFGLEKILRAPSKAVIEYSTVAVTGGYALTHFLSKTRLGKSSSFKERVIRGSLAVSLSLAVLHNGGELRDKLEQLIGPSQVELTDVEEKRKDLEEAWKARRITSSDKKAALAIVRKSDQHNYAKKKDGPNVLKRNRKSTDDYKGCMAVLKRHPETLVLAEYAIQKAGLKSSTLVNRIIKGRPYITSCYRTLFAGNHGQMLSVDVMVASKKEAIKLAKTAYKLYGSDVRIGMYSPSKQERGTREYMVHLGFDKVDGPRENRYWTNRKGAFSRVDWDPMIGDKFKYSRKSAAKERFNAFIKTYERKVR